MPSKKVMAVANPLAVPRPLPLLAVYIALSKSASRNESDCLKFDLTLNRGFVPNESLVVVDHARDPPLVSWLGCGTGIVCFPYLWDMAFKVSSVLGGT